MNGAKPWYRSTGVLGGIGSLVALLAMVLKMVFGVDITDLAPALTEGLLAVVALVGTIIAIYGRVTATKQIGSDGSAPPGTHLMLVLLLALVLVGCAEYGARVVDRAGNEYAATYRPKQPQSLQGFAK